MKNFLFIILFLSCFPLLAQFRTHDQYLGGGADLVLSSGKENLNFTGLYLKFKSERKAQGFSFNFKKLDHMDAKLGLNVFNKRIVKGNGTWFWGLHQELGIGYGGKGAASSMTQSVDAFNDFHHTRLHGSLGLFAGLPMQERWIFTTNLNHVFLMGLSGIGDRPQWVLRTAMAGHTLQQFSFHLAYRLNP